MFSSKLLVDHKSKNSHHGSTAVVELNSTLLQFGLFIKLVPSEIKESIAEITREFTSSSDVLHDKQFKESDKSDNLVNSGSGDTVSTNGGPSIREGVEGVSVVVNASGKVESCTSNDVSEERQHRNTSVLKLNISKTIESVLVSASDQSERIVKTKRRLGTDSLFESTQGSTRCLLLGRGEGSSRSDKGCEDGRLHGIVLF